MLLPNKNNSLVLLNSECFFVFFDRVLLLLKGVASFLSPSWNRLQPIMPNVFSSYAKFDTLGFRVGRYVADKLYLLSPVITPSTEKENEDNLRWREGKGGRGCQNNVWCGKLLKLTNRKLLGKSCALKQSLEILEFLFQTCDWIF